jgi:hypothetical protein
LSDCGPFTHSSEGLHGASGEGQQISGDFALREGIRRFLSAPAHLDYVRRAYRSVNRRKIVGGCSMFLSKAADFKESAVSGAK